MHNSLFQLLQIVEEKITTLENKFASLENDCIIAFRGESKDFGNSALTPSFLRESPIKVSKEEQLLNLLKDFQISENDSSTNLENAIASQHYLAYSRLLDITFNVLAAIYFACENIDEEYDDAILYIFSFPNYYSPHSNYLNNYFDAILKGEPELYYENFHVITHSYLNERVRAQNGGFILFPSEIQHKIPNLFYEKITIKKEDKKQIIQNLEKFFNVSKATIYPEKDKRSAYVKNRLLSPSTYSKDVSISTEVQKYIDFLKTDVEIFLREKKDSQSITSKLRELRKKRVDLISYIDKSKSSKEDLAERKIIKTLCENEIKILEIDIKGNIK